MKQYLEGFAKEWQASRCELLCFIDKALESLHKKSTLNKILYLTVHLHGLICYDVCNSIEKYSKIIMEGEKRDPGLLLLQSPIQIIEFRSQICRKEKGLLISGQWRPRKGAQICISYVDTLRIMQQCFSNFQNLQCNGNDRQCGKCKTKTR